jgi:hypothetical protein
LQISAFESVKKGKQIGESFINYFARQDVEKRQKKRLLLDYLSENLKHHNWWAYRYFFCEFLALINVIGTVFQLRKHVAPPSPFRVGGGGAGVRYEICPLWLIARR